jgi:hypothetical protein
LTYIYLCAICGTFDYYVFLLCKVQCTDLFNIEVLFYALVCSMRILYIYKKKNSYSAVRFIISDDIEEKIVVLSGNWKLEIFTFTFL